MATRINPAQAEASENTGKISEKAGERAGLDVGRILVWPPVVWVLAGFFFFFVFYFIKPTFLNPYHQFLPYGNFPIMEPIGADLREFLNFSKALVEQGSPYIDPNYYPPLESLFFLPLIYTSPDRAYVIITLVSLACFFGITLLFPLLLSRERRITAMLAFLLVSGLFSYGFLFEIERGQFDIIVMALCLAGLYLYHRHPRLSWLGYVLFSLSIQVKIFTGIFLLCFVRDWHDWKRNLLRWGALLLANFAALFLLGPKIFSDFITALQKQTQTPSYVWLGNHSINSFTKLIVGKIIEHGIDPHTPVLQTYQTLMQLALLAIYGLCLAAVLWVVYRRRLSPLNPTLVLVLAVGCMVIPSTSHDYKLAVFAAPVTLFFNSLDWHRSGRLGIDVLSTLLVIIIGVAYTSMLFLHNDVPLLLSSNTPALLLIAAAAAGLMWVRERGALTT